MIRFTVPAILLILFASKAGATTPLLSDDTDGRICFLPRRQLIGRSWSFFGE
jgi:hypothetical protein